MKYRYPAFYERLYQHRDHYLALTEKKHNYLTYYGLRKVVKEEPSSDNKDKQSSFLAYLKQENYHQDDIEIINGLMLALFNNYSWSTRASNSIVYPSSFERYFRFRLASNEISDDQFKKAWEKGFSGMSKFIEKCGKENLIQQLTNRLFMVAPKQRDEFELLIRSFFTAGSLYKKAKIKSWFDYDALTILLWDYQGLQAHRFYGNDMIEYTKLLNELFYKAPFPYLFHSELIHELNEKGQRIPISKKELIDYQIMYFCEYVNTNSLDATAIDLMWDVRIRRAYEDKDGTTKEDVLFFVEELKPHILHYLKHQDKTEFLKQCIKREHSTSNEYSIYPAILDLFDPPLEFRKLLKEDDTTKPEIIKEFLDFFDKLLAIGFTVAIKFPFETELKPKSEEDQ